VKRIAVAFLWHLHQPQYRLRGERICPLPWVRLHGIRAYYDMVRVLEEFPEIRVTINLVPCLLDQIQAYGEGSTDQFLEMGEVPAEELDEVQKEFLFDRFFSAGEARMIGSLPAYAELLRRRHQARRVRGRSQAWKEFATGDFRDLQALFDLSWFGFKAREDFPEIRALRGQGRGFTRDDLVRIHQVEREILARLIPLYRRAATSGQLEVATSPFAHPILPLLCDTQSAREALPDLALPPRLRAPEDAARQIGEALGRMEKEIGVRPRGMWPSEGSVSDEVAAILARSGVQWAASDEQVLAESNREGPADSSIPWNLPGAPGLDLVFRDHDLSDRIGFTYSWMSAGAAVANLLAALKQRAESRPQDPGFVLVALDGENPWENYAGAGGDFLRTLYGALVGNPEVHCLPVAETVQAAPRRGTLKGLRAGSWIGANFGIWIGGPEKNRAWELLGETRGAVIPALSDASFPADRRAAGWAALRSAEGSDWFWWLDGQFHSSYRAEFDAIFRGHLRQAYEALEKKAPQSLDEPIPAPGAPEVEATPLEPAVWLSPAIDGFESHFFEWEGAVRVEWAALARHSTMERSKRWLEALEFGFARGGEFLLRIDPAADGSALFAGLKMEVIFRAEESAAHLSLVLDGEGNLARTSLRDGNKGSDGSSPERASRAQLKARKILELAVPADEARLAPGRPASFQIKLRRGDDELVLEEVELKVPPAEGSGRSWTVS
jgi:alpha-amylase/alpha-mannosidase (GH57 family)